MFSSRSMQITVVFPDVFGKALPNLCRSFYNETKAEMFFSVFAVALLAEGVDRNFLIQTKAQVLYSSPSSRRAWIEMCGWPCLLLRWPFVALLAEGVDRNFGDCGTQGLRWIVALLAEGVDRNFDTYTLMAVQRRSPSSRRAWIEIHLRRSVYSGLYVALLAEGVDRNESSPGTVPLPARSPSSRRAWIEIE